MCDKMHSQSHVDAQLSAIVWILVFFGIILFILLWNYLVPRYCNCTYIHCDDESPSGHIDPNVRDVNVPFLENNDVQSQ